MLLEIKQNFLELFSFSFLQNSSCIFKTTVLSSRRQFYNVNSMLIYNFYIVVTQRKVYKSPIFFLYFMSKKKKSEMKKIMKDTLKDSINFVFSKDFSKDDVKITEKNIDARMSLEFMKVELLEDRFVEPLLYLNLLYNSTDADAVDKSVAELESQANLLFNEDFIKNYLDKYIPGRLSKLRMHHSILNRKLGSEYGYLENADKMRQEREDINASHTEEQIKEAYKKVRRSFSRGFFMSGESQKTTLGNIIKEEEALVKLYGVAGKLMADGTELFEKHLKESANSITKELKGNLEECISITSNLSQKYSQLVNMHQRFGDEIRIQYSSLYPENEDKESEADADIKKNFWSDFSGKNFLAFFTYGAVSTGVIALAKHFGAPFNYTLFNQLYFAGTVTATNAVLSYFKTRDLKDALKNSPGVFLGAWTGYMLGMMI